MSDESRKVETPAFSSTFWGTVQVALVCAGIIIGIYLLPGHVPAPRRLWVPAVVEKNGSLTVMGETRQMNFWTPSVQTKDYLVKPGGAIGDPDKWQVLSNDEPLLQFGLMLHTNAEVIGYRRTEVWGHGRSVFKPGWWWTVNTLTNFSAAEMGHAYQSFWKCSSPVFIEVVENRGSEQ